MITARKTAWTRRAGSRLAEVAMQVALAPDEAEQALTLGARFMAHGFSGREIEEMIMDAYHRRAVVEASIKARCATPSQIQRYLEFQAK